MISSEIRTDLALEAHESIRNTDSCKSLHGVTVSEYDRKKSHTHITEVNVTTRNGAKAIGKPMGTYITIEAPRMVQNDEGCHREISAELARQLKKLIPGLQKEQSVLVIGLGNRDVTADALGPAVVDHLCITRHIIREYGKAAYNKEKMHEISALAPGVMAKNGMETAEIIRGVVKQTKPDVMIVIDALAAQLHKKTEFHDSADRHRYPARLRRREPPERPDRGNHRNPCHCHWRAHSRRCSHHCDQCTGKH